MFLGNTQQVRQLQKKRLVHGELQRNILQRQCTFKAGCSYDQVHYVMKWLSHHTVNTRSATMLTGSLIRSLSFVNRRAASSPTWATTERVGKECETTEQKPGGSAVSPPMLSLRSTE
jgi:hypothetical protein